MSTSKNAKKLKSDRGKTAQQQGNKGNFVRKSVDCYDVPGSFDDPDAESDSSASHLKPVALPPRPDYSMQRGSKAMAGRYRCSNAGDSFGFKSSKKNPSPMAQNMVPQSGEKNAAVANTKRSVLDSSGSNRKATLSPSAANVPLSRAGYSSQNGIDGNAMVLGEESLDHCTEGVAGSFPRKGNKPRRYREKLRAHDRLAVYSNKSSQGGGKRRARKHRIKTRPCRDLTRASGLDTGPPRNHWRYRDKMNKRSNKLSHALEAYDSNAQEPLGTPEDPYQYFGAVEPDFDMDATPLPESTIEEITPGAVSISMEGGARPLRKGHLTVLSDAADDDSYLVAMCARENEFENESLQSSLKPRMLCGTRMKIALVMLVIAAIAIGVAVPLLLSKQEPVDSTAPVDSNERREAVEAVVSKVTDTAMLYQEGSPQNMAFEWIVNKDELSPVGSSPNAEDLRKLMQRYALAVFLYATDDDVRLAPRSEECLWKFVSCDVFATVTSIDIVHKNFFSGSIPREIGVLSSIRELRIASCKLLSIPTEIGLLTNLGNLTLSNNRLTEWFPDELFSLSQLLYLDLSGNKLASSIPTELSKLTQLDYLDLSRNQITGTIPTEFGLLSNLNYLHLGGNQITGTIPTEIGLLSKLNYLDLSWNQITGAIPTEMGLISKLNEFKLVEAANWCQ